jgi:hypothetical protein
VNSLTFLGQLTELNEFVADLPGDLWGRLEKTPVSARLKKLANMRFVSRSHCNCITTAASGEAEHDWHILQEHGSLI